MSSGSVRGIQPGGVTILVIFAALCLAIFSALSLASVRADARLSEKYATQASRYYAADTKAEIWLQQTDTTLQALIQQSDNEAIFWDKVAISFGSAFNAQTHQLSFEAPLSEMQALQIKLQLAWHNDPPVIVSWKAVPTAEATFNDEINVWAGAAQ